MNIAYEFSKVKDAFKKVKTDMDEITDKIYGNYNHFLKEHENMQHEIKKLSKQIQEGLDHFKNNHLKNIDSVPQKEILDIRKEIADLKLEISKTYHISQEFNDTLELVKRNQGEIKDLKNKIHSNDLEICLLKEKLLEKDLQLTKLKDVNAHMLNIMDELSRTELEILNRTA